MVSALVYLNKDDECNGAQISISKEDHPYGYDYNIKKI